MQLGLSLRGSSSAACSRRACVSRSSCPITRRHVLASAHAEQHAAHKQQQQQHAAPAAAAEAAAAATEEAAPEAVQDMEQKPEEPEYVEVEVTTEVEEEYIDKGFQPQVMLQDTQQYLTGTNVGRVISVGAIGLLLGTLAVAVHRTYLKANTVKAKRLRQIERNKLLVTELSKYLPDQRFKLKPGTIGNLQRTTGYTNVEVFRKYLWYVLRERKFDQDAVEDVLTVKLAAGLTDDDVAEALGERAQRIYDKYGTLMLNTEGFTASGLERKATCKALFQKVLYLTECDALVKQGSEAASKINLRVIFGATDEDIDKLRIVSLYDVDLEKVFNQGATSQDGKPVALVSDDEADQGPAALEVDPLQKPGPQP